MFLGLSEALVNVKDFVNLIIHFLLLLFLRAVFLDSVIFIGGPSDELLLLDFVANLENVVVESADFFISFRLWYFGNQFWMLFLLDSVIL